ncbi:MAG: sugar phosphate nucleotidyltransferase [Spirochaetes bacterium]|jgi:UDP-N-acetylglucosamine diphosphorylase/glucosamine-1-phosphate N-acetyltransferase|nr:sugar phosphate nucleotidyltransferase [Spirochaetota bacterium]
MKSDIPKVLHNLNGKPLVQHVINSLRSSGIEDVILVVGYRGETVISEIGNSVKYVWQHEQLGTGHAVMQAEKALEEFKGRVIIACGDAPGITPETFRRMIGESKGEKTKAVVLTMIQENPTGYGRIIKDINSRFVKIVEEKDASPEEKKEKEVNTGTYVFDRDSLFSGLKNVGTNNAQGEYYLTDVLQYIASSGYNVKRVVLDNPVEGSGINSREELERLEQYIKNKENN